MYHVYRKSVYTFERTPKTYSGETAASQLIFPLGNSRMTY